MDKLLEAKEKYTKGVISLLVPGGGENIYKSYMDRTLFVYLERMYSSPEFLRVGYSGTPPKTTFVWFAPVDGLGHRRLVNEWKMHNKEVVEAFDNYIRGQIFVNKHYNKLIQFWIPLVSDLCLTISQERGSDHTIYVEI